ncbi:DUF3558 domain-containing protein [Lentzea sp. NPDC102401]|uniref:DUF3558 domain-containing protein n=1 Tax=Lentzea sp. NPDC102401 TaxID=3364128 RepID=UPI00382C53F1
MLTRFSVCSLAAGALLLAGCHNKDGSFSQAVPHSPATSPPSSQVSAAETVSAPAPGVSLRPREIRFDENTSACDLLLPRQVERLGGDKRNPTFHTDPVWRSPACSFGGPTRIWSVITVTESGVKFLLDAQELHRQLKGELQVENAAPIAMAFPAHTAVDPARRALSCYLAVDTANEQMLMIGIELRPPTKTRDPCTEARAIAEEVMHTLIT